MTGLASEEIEMQPNHLGCGYYAVVNLLKSLGHRSPRVFQVRAAYRAFRAQEYGDKCLTEDAPLSIYDLFRLCIDFGAHLPFTFGLWAIPSESWAKPEGFITGLLAQGARLLAGYHWRRPTDGTAIGHALVVEGFGEQGYKVLDSAGGYAEDSIISLEPNPTPAEYRDMLRRQQLHKHGARRILPYIPVRRGRDALGLEPLIVAAYPRTA